MGVMACDRLGCTNILCEMYSHNHGYICKECHNEMLEKLGKTTTTDAINKFMASEKGIENIFNTDEVFKIS